jgi:hypothetical protein
MSHLTQRLATELEGDILVYDLSKFFINDVDELFAQHLQLEQEQSAENEEGRRKRSTGSISKLRRRRSGSGDHTEAVGLKIRWI